MATVICPACEGTGYRIYQPLVKESPHDIEVICDLCRDQGIRDQPRQVPPWKANWWEQHPTPVRPPHKKANR